MPIGYTALKTVASMESMAGGGEGKAKKRRGHAPGNRGNCCKQCGKACGRFCRLSALTQCLILMVVLLFCMTALLWIGGASLTGPAKNNLHTGQLCGAEKKGGSGGGEEVEGVGEEGEEVEDSVGDEDPTVFLLRQNVYAWYLANTGIIVTFTIFSSCVCCLSYVGLCCGLPKWAKICGVIGFIIVVICFSLYVIWVATGVYLIINFDKLALFTSTCRNVLIYEVFLVLYLVVVVVVAVVFCVWRGRDKRRRERTTPKQKHKTTPTPLAV